MRAVLTGQRAMKLELRDTRRYLCPVPVIRKTGLEEYA